MKGTTQHNSSRTIDPTWLESLRGIDTPGDADFVTELIDLFLNEAASQFAVLRGAIMNDNELAIRQIAHRMKGSSANIGAGQLATLFEALEDNSLGRDSNSVLTELENEFELVRRALEAERKVAAK